MNQLQKDDVTRALTSLKNGKAPGPDGVTGDFFSSSFLIECFRCCTRLLLFFCLFFVVVVK